MADIGVNIPMSATPIFGFECPLNDPEPTADILTYHNNKSGAREFLSRVSPHNTTPQVELNSWKKVNRFENNWATPATNDVTSLENKIDDFWLEFDIRDYQGSGIPEPSFFFGPIMSDIEQDQNLKKGYWKRHLFDTIRKGLDALEEDSEDDYKTLENCIDKLPEHGRIFQVGKMLSRPYPGFRICLSNLSENEAVAYLSELGVTEKLITPIQKWMEIMRPFVRRICPSFDLTNRVEPKIGIEFYLKKGPVDDPLAYWRIALTKLVDEEYCLDDKKNGLLNYPKDVTKQNAVAPWPSSLSKMETFIGNKQHSAFILSLHHMKMSFSLTKAPVAKAYLAVETKWI